MNAFDDRRLIFLVSQPRAGSTLLQRILGAHAAIHTTAEPWLMLHPLYARRADGHTAEYDATLAQTAVDDFVRTLPDGEAVYREALRGMALALYGTAVAAAGKTLFLDKTPRYYFILPELAALFPQARFILLLRNPLAVLNSILNTHVKGHWPLLSRYREDLLTAPERLLAAQAALGARAHTVRYEALVREPEARVTALCDWLEVPFDAAMIEYGRAARPQGSMGDATGIEQFSRPSTAPLAGWQALGRQPQTRHLAESYVQALGAELLARMGYPAAELLAAIQAQPCPAGEPAVTWQTLFATDEPFTRRQRLTELALLEHRRFVFWARGRLDRLRRK